MSIEEMGDLRHPTKARIAELLESGPAFRSEIIAKAGWPPEEVSYHCSAMQHAGRIRYAGLSGRDAIDPLFELN